jgi:hypothetical protein
MALTQKQMRFAEPVAAGRSQVKAAEAVKISPRQAQNWMRDILELRERIDRLSRDAQAQAVQILSSLLTAAAATLGEMLKPGHPDSIRLAAARGVFADFVAMSQYVDLVAELNAIKAQLAAQKGGPP